ncbi:MAG: flagellin [Ancalomicrobiaceae bacterium]|nr:flagellin [Ancalomicrobiaceae bacterium]
MSMRVATFASTNTLMQAALRTQAQEADVTEQESSGLKSSNYGGLGSDAGKVVSLQASVTRSKAYSSAATSANQRTQQMYSSLGSIIDTLTSFKSELSSFDATTSDTGTSALKSDAATTLDSVVSALNAKFGGTYLFAGSAVDTKPVDVSSMTAQTDPVTTDTSYYSGDDAIASVKVGDDQTIRYGVTANDDSIEQAIRGLNTIAGGTTDTTTISSVSDLVDTALTGITTLQSKLSLNSKALESAISRETTFQSDMTSTISDLDSVDIATATASLSNYKNQLEASYSALGKIQSLSLDNYLK